MDQSSQSDSLSFDAKLLSEFLYALNILRRQVAAYPPGHPIIQVALHNLFMLNQKLLEFRPSITISIARDTLYVDNHHLNPRDPVLKDLAKNLFEAKVASLTITSELSADEICRFLELLRTRKDAGPGTPALSLQLAQAGVHGLTAREIDFSAFHKTEVIDITAPKPQFVESETALLWKAFAEGLSLGTLDPRGARETPGMRLDPDLLAEVLNREATDPEAVRQVEATYEEAITDYLVNTDRERIRSRDGKETLGRLGSLIEKLNPDLRLRFINSTLKACATHNDKAEELVAGLPQSAIVTVLEQAGSTGLQIPQSLLDVLGKLAGYRDKGETGSRVVGDRQRTHRDKVEELSRLFRADHVEDYVGKDYQDALKILATAEVPSPLESDDIAGLAETLEGHVIERHFCKVLLDLLKRGPEPQFNAALLQNLEEIVDYFNDAGDFMTLAGVHRQCQELVGQAPETPSAMPGGGLLDIFSSARFICKFVDGLDLWDRSAQTSIVLLAGEVGEPLAIPLLDRLADEQHLSMRRLLMDCLKSLGSTARAAILQRLTDKRWYFVRNLVILLRETNDPQVLQSLRWLMDHHHPKVRFEVMATFLKFNDRRVNHFLLGELDSRDAQRLLRAIKLASISDDPEIVRALAQLLNARLPIEHETALKTAVINALAERGNGAALPELEKFLLGRHLLPGGRSIQLKLTALRSLTRYSAAASLALAEEVARVTTGELGKAAEGIALQLRSRTAT